MTDIPCTAEKLQEEAAACFGSLTKLRDFLFAQQQRPESEYKRIRWHLQADIDTVNRLLLEGSSGEARRT
jgi:hypothetical protein